MRLGGVCLALDLGPRPRILKYLLTLTSIATGYDAVRLEISASLEGLNVEQITRINHIGLRVRDLDVTRAFYENLGFEFIVGPIGPEPVAVMEHASGININFILNASSDASDSNVLMDVTEKHTGFTHIALEITDIEAVQLQLSKLGIGITETVELPDGTIFFFIRDPDNNVIEFHKPA